MKPEQIAQYLALIGQAYGLFQSLVAQFKAEGVTDEQIAAITADYDARIAQAQAEGGGV